MIFKKSPIAKSSEGFKPSEDFFGIANVKNLNL